MPRGKKKTETANTLLENTAEKSAEIVAPVDVVSEKSINAAATATDKPKSKTGRKPKSASAISEKDVAEKTERNATTTVLSDISKSKGKANRIPKENKAIPKPEKSAAAETTKKAATTEKKTPAKSGKKPSSTKKNAPPAPAPIDTTAEKKKRAYNKKVKSAKTEDIIIQSGGNEYSMNDISEMCKNNYRAGTRKQIKSIKVYIKAENNGIRAYYVINDSASSYIDL